MAAGLGTRLRPFTDLCPKPFLPLMGVPVAQYAVDLCAHHHIKRLAVNFHHLPDVAKAEISRLNLGSIDLKISDESELLLGSAGGVREVLDDLSPGPFFLLNADVISTIDLQRLAEAHSVLRKKNGVTMTLALQNRALPGGEKYTEIVCNSKKGLITGLGQKSDTGLFFTGAAVLETSAVLPLNKGPAEFVPAVLKPAIESGQAGFYVSDSLWLDIGSPRLWRDAHFRLMAALEKGDLPEWMSERLERLNVTIAPGVWKNKSSQYSQASRFLPPVYLGAEDPYSGKEFGPNCVLYGTDDGSPRADGIGWKSLWFRC